MEMDLKNIIEKIKEEGVFEADKKAAEIVEEASKKAKDIIQTALKEKEDIIKNAAKEAEKLTKNGEEAVRQASRDVLLSLREDIVALFDRLTKKDVAEQLSPDVLKDMIVRLVESVTEHKQFDIEVLLSKKDKDVLDRVLFDALKQEAKKGVTLKVSPGIEHGFRIGEKGGTSYYDFTDEAIAEAFALYLNPKIAEVLTAGAKNAK
ncbi:MAG: V-type ATP synthase subunit E [Candidatus Omnitrophota bacterium]